MKSAAEYIKASSRCPKCDSDEITGDSLIEADGPGAWQSVSCAACEFQWYDEYELVGYTLKV